MKTKQELKDEFNQLRNDDPDFENQYNKHEFMEWIFDHNLNTCDKCEEIQETYNLIWLTTEDFKPTKKEKEKYKMAKNDGLFNNYDALCEHCYNKIINK